jgi:hypothetical protein
MCYSVESSAKTTLISLIAVIVLLQSNVTHFKWIALSLVGWCVMQFNELLLWLTNPRKECTDANKFITLVLTPLVILLQSLGTVLGSFFVKPWKECSENRKLFIVVYSLVVTFGLLFLFFRKIEKTCTVVTKSGHLHWLLTKYIPSTSTDYDYKYLMLYSIWFIVTLIPFLLWDVSYKIIIVLCIMPIVGFFYGLKTDSAASIWCHYSSYTSIVGLIIYGLYKFNIYNILK